MEAPLISLDVARRLPWLPRPVSLPTMYRYVRPGLKGVRLRVSRAAGGLCTTEVWLSEFFAAAAATSSTAEAGRPRVARTKGHERAERLLDAVGI